MPRFHFNIHDGRFQNDIVGLELIDLAAARKEAIQVMSRLLHHESEKFWTADGWQVEVTDGRGLILFTIIISAYDAPAIQKA